MKLMTCMLHECVAIVSLRAAIIDRPSYSAQSILPYTGNRCYEAKTEESKKARSCQESNPGHL